VQTRKIQIRKNKPQLSSTTLESAAAFKLQHLF
jgi:hypothetical protein